MNENLISVGWTIARIKMHQGLFKISIPFIDALGPGWLNCITQVLTGNSCIVFQCDRLLSGTTWRSMTRHLHWHLCLPLSSSATQVVETWLTLVNDTLDVGCTSPKKNKSQLASLFPSWSWIHWNMLPTTIFIEVNWIRECFTRHLFFSRCCFRATVPKSA